MDISKNRHLKRRYDDTDNIDIDIAIFSLYQPVVTALAWIPGHSGVFYNERADSMAKLALSRHADVSDEPLTFPSCKRLILKQVVARWQDHLDNSTTGRVTYEMIPVVGYKTTYQRNRCIAVSYARLLLHDTSLKDHQYRLDLVYRGRLPFLL